MIWLPLVIIAALDACPKVWILDMTTLPPKVPADYRLTITVVLADGQTGDLSYDIYKGAKPDGLHITIYAAFISQKNAKVEKDGLKVLVRKLGGKDIRRITVRGDGPLPGVGWKFAPQLKE